MPIPINLNSSYDKNSFLNHLKKESKPIKCYISISGEYSSSSYNFKISPVGFSNALSKIRISNNGSTDPELKKAEANLFSDDTIINSISAAINFGNSKEISTYFIDHIDLKIIEVENVFSKQQAVTTLNEFFEKHKVKTYTELNKISQKNGLQIVIGRLETTNGIFKIYFLMKTIGSSKLIQQFRIEFSE